MQLLVLHLLVAGVQLLSLTFNVRIGFCWMSSYRSPKFSTKHHYISVRTTSAGGRVAQWVASLTSQTSHRLEGPWVRFPQGTQCGTNGVSQAPHRGYPHPGRGRRKGLPAEFARISPCPRVSQKRVLVLDSGFTSQYGALHDGGCLPEQLAPQKRLLQC